MSSFLDDFIPVLSNGMKYHSGMKRDEIIRECLPFSQKIRKFQLECKWKGYFGLPDRKISEINGTSSDVVQNSQPEYPNGKCAFHFLFLLVPDLSVCFRPGGDVRGNGTRTSRGNFHSGF